MPAIRANVVRHRGGAILFSRLLALDSGTFGGDAKRKAQALKAMPTLRSAAKGREPSV